ncbi:conserved hypothetical protein [Frankia sp. AiPs1]|uniref:heparinase II/III domain-containing protein n=1 Tax=Frankia sp. AiPa1 TaxID=573492 RepID=UPI00202B2EA4|nr:heparinase II/III family protein [Frankia sp. AiPa1]MCL9759241.1 heparinase II/III family protein [Frankia sp. AiPa1]
MSTPAEVGRYLRTLAHLRPGQIVARGRLRAQRVGLSQAPRTATALLRTRATPGYWPTGFVPLDGQCPAAGPSAEDLARGRISLLGHARNLTQGRPDRLDWEQAGAPLLWRYHLHYWDWAWALAGDGMRGRATFTRLYLDWRTATPLGHPVAWSPYVASLRAWTLCALHPVLAPASTLTSVPANGITPTARAGATAAVLHDVLRADLGTLHAFLRAHQETDVGGNHLMKNLKALVALEIAAGDRHGLRRRLDALLRQIDRQILADGGHHERTPAYHCQVLADLDDVAGLLSAAGRPVPDELSDATVRMRRWLATVLGPDGTVPLLNDGFPVPRTLLRRLLPDCAPTDRAPSTEAPPVEAPPAGVRPRTGPRTAAGAAEAVALRGTGAGAATASTVGGVPDAVLLPDSGLAVLTAGGWHLLADVGLPCPDDLPAHAHADTLGFLLWLDGVPVLVDPATSTYAPGPRRDRERGTAAHSTVTLDDADSTEVWGAFRAGRRAHPSAATLHRGPTAVTLSAGHDGYRYLPGAPRHQRHWRLDRHGLVVRDRVSGTGRHRLTVRFHFAAGITLAPDITVRAPAAGAASAMPRGAGSPGTAPRDALPSSAAARDATVDPVLALSNGRRLELRTGVPGQWRVRTTARAIGWERTVPALSAELTIDATLPVTVETILGLCSRPVRVPAARPAPSDTSRSATRQA